mgnify:FL=1|jgi:uncharacterized alkaline shock family protein YloU
MKLIEKIILVIYSIIMLILSLIFCLLIFRWADINLVQNSIMNVLNNTIYSSIALAICVIFILMSIRCIFFISKKSDYYKNDILLKNEEGKLIITKVTIENLVNNVIKGFESAQEVTTKVKFDKENNVIINISLLAKEQANMKELSNNIQVKVKEAIKKASDLDVKEINVKVKNIETAKNIIQE